MKSTTQSHAANPHSALAYFWVLLLLAAALYVGTARAEPVGQVVNLSDPSQLLAKKADGRIKVLNQHSWVDNGDILESQNKTYAKIKFIDGTDITLAPNTQFKIDNYSFDAKKPEEDRSLFTFTLIKGTLRSISGELGQRNKDRYQLNTPAATIGIRGTTYLARYIPPEDATGMPKDAKDKKVKEHECDRYHSALTSEVIEGVIYLVNDGGTQVYKKGEFGCATSSRKAPIVLEDNPDIEFNPSFGKSLQCNL
jgi:hypothetical protein